jgi:pimeloyl-ACP methyl ester carboxylesterase
MYRSHMPSLMRVAAAVVATLIILSSAVAAQSPAPSSPAIVLQPVVEPAYGISSVVPDGWTAVGMGIHTRGASAADPTLLALQSTPVPVAQLWPSLLPQLGLDSQPEAIETRAPDTGLAWSLYQVPIAASDTVADLALAHGEGVSYLVLLVSRADESAWLRETVFLPAVDAYAPLAAASPTPGSDAYREMEVTFPGGSADVTLAGTLSVPTAPGPHPAVVLMSGSGPQDRDESLPGLTLKPFAVLADALAEVGVAVLRYDDRGTARSTGDYNSAVVEDFTADGAAALAWLREQDGVDPARTGILGHSEGGLYIADIAAQDPDVAFVVGLAPVARPGVDLLVDQNEAIARSQGAPEAEVAIARQFAADLYAAGMAEDLAAAEAIVREYFGALYDRQDAAGRQAMGDRDAFIDGHVRAQLDGLRQPWFLSLLRSDAEADWRRVTAPTLGVFGGKDVQVIATQEAPALEAALVAAGNDDYQVVTLPDANHLFQSATTGALAEYATLEQAFTPDLLPLVVDWIVERSGAQP